MANIGIDVDGVLTDLEKYQLHYGKKYFKNINNIDETKIDIEDIFSVSKKEREIFWIKYIWKYCLSIPARENAAAVFKKLKEEGHNLYIITSRAHATEEGITGKLFRKMLFDWLDKEGIIYDDIELCREHGSEIDKLEACKKFNIDIMIDDKAENVMTLAKICKVLCFDAKYNKDCIGDNIIRVHNFNEIYSEIEKIVNENKFRKEDNRVVQNYSIEDKIEYYKNLREYYKQLPYDRKLRVTQERNYKKLSKIGVPLFKSLFNITVFGRENIPQEDGCLFVANHNNYYDQFPIICAIGDHRPIHFLVATKMLKLKRGGIYLKTGSISVDREDKNDRKNANEEVKKILANGGNVFIFPEGRTNRNESFLLDFHPGAVSIAQELGCKIVPIAVNDNYGKNDGDLCVRFGEPYTISIDSNIEDENNRLREIIGELKQQNIDYVEKKKVKKI